MSDFEYGAWAPNSEWIEEMAKQEEGYHSFSVGGLASEFDAEIRPSPDSRAAFTRFIDLARRNQKLSIEALAGAADVDLRELVGILEEGISPSPRAVYKLAGVLGVPIRRLLELAGLAEARDPVFVDAAVRFAARSEPTAALTKHERAALDEFVKVLVQSSDPSD